MVSRRPAAIRVEGGAQIRLKDVKIEGFDTGISYDGAPGSQITAENVSFDNVRLPYDIRGVEAAHIKGSRIANDPKLNHRPPSRPGSSVGWRRLEGPPLPVFCPSCKTIFPSQNHQFVGTYFYLWDNEEPCPECGNQHAKVSEGVFDLTKDAVRILTAPDVTYALLTALQGVLERAAAGEINPAQAAAQIEAINPSLAKWLKKATEFGERALLLALAIIGTTYAVKSYDAGGIL